MFKPGRKVGGSTTPAVKVEPISGFRFGLPELRTDGFEAPRESKPTGKPFARQFAARPATAPMFSTEQTSDTPRKLSAGGENRASMFRERTSRATPPRNFTSSLTAHAPRTFHVLFEPELEYLA